MAAGQLRGRHDLAVTSDWFSSGLGHTGVAKSRQPIFEAVRVQRSWKLMLLVFSPVTVFSFSHVDFCFIVLRICFCNLDSPFSGTPADVNSDLPIGMKLIYIFLKKKIKKNKMSLILPVYFLLHSVKSVKAKSKHVG